MKKYLNLICFVGVISIGAVELTAIGGSQGFLISQNENGEKTLYVDSLDFIGKAQSKVEISDDVFQNGVRERLGVDVKNSIWIGQ